MKKIIVMLMSGALAALASASCQGVLCQLEDMDGAASAEEYVDLPFFVERTPSTRSAVLPGESDASRENRITSLELLAFTEGVLYDSFYADNLGLQSITLRLKTGCDYSFYALVNRGERVSFSRESDVVGYAWPVDGIDGWAEYGFPMCWSRTGYRVSGTESIAISLDRLVSRWTFSLDLSELPELVITGAAIRQAAGAVYPFSPGLNSVAGPVSGDRATDAHDTDRQGHALGQTDLDLLNSGGSITLYVPENLQGTLLPGNGSSLDKTPQKLDEASVPASVQRQLTYLEFTAEFDESGAFPNYSGDILYRFYLGKDTTTNFDMHRNTNYSMTITPSVESVDSEVFINWEVDNSNVTINDWEILCNVHPSEYVGKWSYIDFPEASASCPVSFRGPSADEILVGSGTRYDGTMSGYRFVYSPVYYPNRLFYLPSGTSGMMFSVAQEGHRNAAVYLCAREKLSMAVCTEPVYNASSMVTDYLELLEDGTERTCYVFLVNSDGDCVPLQELYSCLGPVLGTPATAVSQVLGSSSCGFLPTVSSRHQSNLYASATTSTNIGTASVTSGTASTPYVASVNVWGLNSYVMTDMAQAYQPQVRTVSFSSKGATACTIRTRVKFMFQGQGYLGEMDNTVFNSFNLAAVTATPSASAIIEPSSATFSVTKADRSSIEGSSETYSVISAAYSAGLSTYQTAMTYWCSNISASRNASNGKLQVRMGSSSSSGALPSGGYIIRGECTNSKTGRTTYGYYSLDIRLTVPIALDIYLYAASPTASTVSEYWRYAVCSEGAARSNASSEAARWSRFSLPYAVPTSVGTGYTVVRQVAVTCAAESERLQLYGPVTVSNNVSGVSTMYQILAADNMSSGNNLGLSVLYPRPSQFKLRATSSGVNADSITDKTADYNVLWKASPNTCIEKKALEAGKSNYWTGY